MGFHIRLGRSKEEDYCNNTNNNSNYSNKKPLIPTKWIVIAIIILLIYLFPNTAFRIFNSLINMVVGFI